MSADDHLRLELEQALGASVTALDRRPSAYRTSAALDEVDVDLADGTRVELVLKDVSPEGLGPAARAAKPAFLADARRELAMYRDVLAGADLGTPRFYGAVGDGRWLVLERVRGVELYQVGERGTWAHVARRLAALHDQLDPDAALAAHALRHDAAYYALWPQRAITHAARRGDRAAAGVLEGLADAHAEAVALLLALPGRVLHGELYASNVLVDDPVAPDRVAPVDWEQAAVGPGVVDLAALTSGGWDDEARRAIASAYAETSGQPVGEADLEAARLHLAFQWLGWAEDWSPPVDHRQDWLEEAVKAAARLASIGRCPR